MITSLKIEIPMSKNIGLNQMQYSILAMEIGVIRIRQLMIELEMTEGAQVYDFRKENA